MGKRAAILAGLFAAAVAVTAGLYLFQHEIPAAAVLGDYTSVSIWCARFAVSFAAAELST